MQTAVLRIVLAIVLLAGFAYGKQPDQPTVDSFMQKMVGEWIGIFRQSTDEVHAPPQYFRSVARQTGPSSYETVFRYYEIDPATRYLVDAGTATVVTRIARDGRAINTMNGGGEVLIEEDTPMWEKHRFSEIMEMSSPDILQGSGRGTLTVSDTPYDEEGKDGEIIEYTSNWSMKDGFLRISQQFQVEFKTFIFEKTYNITMDHEVRRGNNIMDLFRNAAVREQENPAAPGEE